jgi:hypothetical protein
MLGNQPQPLCRLLLCGRQKQVLRGTVISHVAVWTPRICTDWTFIQTILLSLWSLEEHKAPLAQHPYSRSPLKPAKLQGRIYMLAGYKHAIPCSFIEFNKIEKLDIEQLC